jgi:hypothetical protein
MKLSTFLRPRLASGLLAAAAAFAANSALAALIAYEPFNYTAGENLDGKTGGFGWAGAWGIKNQVTPNGPAIPANGAVIQAGSLTGPGGLPTLGGHVRMSAENGAFEMARSFPNIAGTNGTTTWFSFIGQRIGDANGGTNWPNNPYPRGANIGLFDAQATAQGGTNFERIGIGNSTTGNAADANHYDEWSLIPQGSGALREGPVSHSPKWSEVRWAVLRIDHVGDATVADSAYLWLNPNPLGGEPSLASADVTILSGDSNSRDLSDVDFIRPFLGAVQNAGNAATQRPAGVMLLDEIRLGTTWADMTAVPEPASAALAGLAVMGLVAVRRKR